MNKYIHINPINQIVDAVLPEYEDIFPNIPLNKRVTLNYFNQCILQTAEYENVHTGMKYNSETQSFEEYIPEPEIIPEPEEVIYDDQSQVIEPSQFERLNAQATYTAMMTDTLLEEEA